MIIIRGRGSAPGTLALHHYNRSAVRKNLAQLGLKPAVFTGVYRLRGLEKGQFDAFVGLLASWKIGHEDLKLMLPPLESLRKVDFLVIAGKKSPQEVVISAATRTRKNVKDAPTILPQDKQEVIDQIIDRARREIIQRCVRPLRRPVVDLTDLPKIYRVFVTEPIRHMLPDLI